MRHRTVALLATLLAAPISAQAPPDLGEKALDPAAAETRGFDYWLGRGVPRDLEQAARWLEQAAASGRPNAAAVLARLYQFGQGLPQDLGRAHELNARAAPFGVASAQTALAFDAVIPRPAGRARDPTTGLFWLNAAAEQEDPSALLLLGQAYRYGDGVEPNQELGMRLVTRAAELRDPGAAMEAGRYLLARDAVAEDVQRGLYFLRTAADAGVGPAAYWLAQLHLTGWHVQRDAGLAAQWLTRANELKFSIATLWLAELYAKGLGVAADSGRAAELRESVLPSMSVAERNEFAWGLAVMPYAELRNGAFAVEVMEAVTTERPTPAYLDTLAAAYAEAGRLEDAVRAQQRAIDALPNGVPAATREAFDERMKLYRSGQPYREAP